MFFTNPLTDVNLQKNKHVILKSILFSRDSEEEDFVLCNEEVFVEFLPMRDNLKDFGRFHPCPVFATL